MLYIGALSSWRLRRNKSFRFPLQIILRPVLIVVVIVVAVVDLVVVYLITCTLRHRVIARLVFSTYTQLCC